MAEPNEGTKMNRRIRKITPIETTLIRLPSGEEWSRIIERAMAYSSTSSALPGLCLASILINSMPMTRLNAWPRNVWKASVLLLVTSENISPAIGTMLISSAISTSTESTTSKMLDTAATWLRSIWVRRRSRAYRCRRR